MRSVMQCVLRGGGGSAGRWTCDLQVATSIPSRWLSRNIGRSTQPCIPHVSLNREPASAGGRPWAGFSPLSGGR